MKELLAGGGTLVGVLFNRVFEESPPFGGSEQEYRELFSAHFNNVSIEGCYNSIPARTGAELFIKIS